VANYGAKHKDLARKKFTDALRNGARSWEQASRMARISTSRYQHWFERDREFRRHCEILLRGDWKRPEVPDIVTLRKDYLGFDTYSCQREWFEAIEANDATLILVPPGHTKTTSLEDYCVTRITRDRNVRIAYISKSQDVARHRAHRVQRQLSDSQWYDRKGLKNLVADYGPFKPGQGETQLQWSRDRFYVTGIDSAERDPTFTALGVGNQIYGGHFDLIILDDVADFKNQAFPGEREKMLGWITQEVQTGRLDVGGKIVVIGTRVHEEDIYSHFLSELPEFAHYTKIVHPAILDEENEKVLCPELWPLERLTAEREKMPARVWSLVWQQQATGMPDAPFSLEAVENSKDPSWQIGVAAPHLKIIMGVDPAFTGTCAIVVIGVDLDTGLRYIIDAPARTGLKNLDNYKDFITRVAAQYGAKECRIEKNNMQGGMNREQDLIARLASTGTRIVEEFTSKWNKFDHDHGVLSVAALFDAGRYRIPWTPMSQPVMRPLCDELLSWRAGLKLKQDRVMALWLAELSARAVIGMPKVDIPNRAPTWLRERRGMTDGPPGWAERVIARNRRESEDAAVAR
jgi:hypothetical protein